MESIASMVEIKQGFCATYLYNSGTKMLVDFCAKARMSGTTPVKLRGTQEKGRQNSVNCRGIP